MRLFSGDATRYAIRLDAVKKLHGQQKNGKLDRRIALFSHDIDAGLIAVTPRGSAAGSNRAMPSAMHEADAPVTC